jgi:hypothetical protein
MKTANVIPTPPPSSGSACQRLPRRLQQSPPKIKGNSHLNHSSLTPSRRLVTHNPNTTMQLHIANKGSNGDHWHTQPAEAAAHNWKDLTCADTAPDADADSGLGTAAVAGIAIGAVVVVACQRPRSSRCTASREPREPDTRHSCSTESARRPAPFSHRRHISTLGAITNKAWRRCGASPSWQEPPGPRDSTIIFSSTKMPS